MPKLHLSPRVTAAVLLLIFGAIPIGIWVILWPRTDFLTSDFLGLNVQGFFIVLAVSAVFSPIAGTLILVRPRQLVLRSAFVGAIAQSLGFAATESWQLAAMAAIPLWWLYKGQHEV